MSLMPPDVLSNAVCGEQTAMPARANGHTTLPSDELVLSFFAPRNRIG